MDLIHWAYYPSVAQNAHAHDWLETQAMLGLAHNTVQAYGRGANDYLTFCERAARPFIEATKADIVAYIDDMTHRSNPKGENIRYLHSGVGLANSLHQKRSPFSGLQRHRECLYFHITCVLCCLMEALGPQADATSGQHCFTGGCYSSAKLTIRLRTSSKTRNIYSGSQPFSRRCI